MHNPHQHDFELHTSAHESCGCVSDAAAIATVVQVRPLVHRTLTNTCFSALLAACALALNTSDVVAQTQLPPPTGEFDYQIGGSYEPAENVTVVSRDPGIDLNNPQEIDSGATPGDDQLYRICYLNALQTQDYDYAWWMDNHPELILMDEDGEPVHDPDPEWAGEMLFDVSTPENRAQLLSLQRDWITNCKRQGYLAIEPDNIDSYTRSQGQLSAADVEAYMIDFVAEAHRQSLAVAQKNAVEWISEGRARSVRFDFAIVEECQLTGECDAVIDHYGAENVFEIEYWYDEEDDSSGVTVPAFSREHFDAACDERGDTTRIVIRNRDVRSSEEYGWYRDICER